MYILSYDHLVETVDALTRVIRVPEGNAHISTKEKLMQMFNTFQPVTQKVHSVPENVFTPTSKMLDVMVASGGVSEIEVTLDSFRMDDRQQKQVTEDIQPAMHLLQEGDGEAYRITDLLVNSIVWCNAKGGGGSLVQNLGLIWFSPKKHWTVETYAENIFHEALHQSLFLEDMVYGVFGDVHALNDERMRVTSNFLKVKRRFDLTFHAVFVASELIKWYRMRGAFEKAQELVLSTQKSINEMDTVIGLARKEGLFVLTKRGVAIFNRIKSDISIV